MKIGAISRYNSSDNSPSFKRKLREDEKPQCGKAIQDGLRTLDKNMCVILPTNCSPSEYSKDVGIGVPYSKSSEKMLFPFLYDWGFTKWQQEPSGLRKRTDASPYASNSSAYNTLIIDLDKLTTPEYGCILSDETYSSTVNNNPRRGQNKSDYTYAVNTNKTALEEAYQTYKYKSENLDELDNEERAAIESLSSDFQQFKQIHGREQEKNALYSILTDKYNNDYWPNWGLESYGCDTSDWDVETDKNLFDKSNSYHEQKQKEARLSHLRSKHKDEIDAFLFSQMLAKKALDNGNKKLKEKGIKPIADIPVAFSDAEVWGNKHLFLKDLRMGCKEPWSNEPQKWGFFVLDPNQLFSSDNRTNQLGEAGKFLYDKYERVFEENKGGVRIDHIVGLIDPYVYSESGNRQGRLYSEVYRGKNGHNCDRILKKIILPAANAAGLDSSAIIAEDLGYMPGNSVETLKNLGIGGLTVTQWKNGDEIWNAPKNNAVMVANHDTASAKELYPDKFERRKKFIDLFASGAKNVQIFWTDLFGIKERYNQPGTTGDQNWSLRMTPDFNDEYHKKLEDYDAVNLPDVIWEANRLRNPNFSHEHRELSESLKHWANVLKERE